MSNDTPGSKHDPWVLSDSDSEPDFSFDIRSIRPDPNRSNSNSNSNNQNNNSSASTSKATLTPRTNSQLKSKTPSSSSTSSSKQVASGSTTDRKNKSKAADSSDDSIEFNGTRNIKMSASQSQREVPPQLPLDTTDFVRLSTFKTVIVGNSFYPTGTANAGEEITFVREPTNPYDSNSVEVRARDIKLGHLARDEARKFASLMDARKIHLEGYMLEKCVGGSGKPRIVMDIKGKESDKKELESALRFTTPSWSGFSELTKSQPTAKQVMEGAPAVKAAAALKIKNEPVARPPPTALTPPEAFDIVVTTFHTTLANTTHSRVDLPSGSPLFIERSPMYGPVLRFLNLRRELAGELSEGFAPILLRLLDQGKIQLEAYVKTGVKASDHHRIVNVVMDIKCRAADYETLKPQLQLFITMGNSMGTSPSKAATVASSFARSARMVAAAAHADAAARDPALEALYSVGDMINGNGLGLDDQLRRIMGAGRVPDPDDDLQEEEELPMEQGAAPGAEMQNLLGQMVAGTYRGTDALTSLYGEEGSLELAELPLHPNPDHWIQHGITADLRSHQSQGVAWMQRAEHRRAPLPGEKQNCLWQARKKRGGGMFWRSIASNPEMEFVLKSREPPALMKGGILADSMGLGKTLTVLALALSDRHARGVRREDKQKADDKKKGIVRDKKSDPDNKAKEDSGSKAAAPASSPQDVKPKSEDLKPTSQELSKASLGSRTPSSSSSTGGSVKKKSGLILPSPPRRIPDTDEEDSQTEEEEDIEPKANKKKSSTAMDTDDESEEDVKPVIPKKQTRNSSKAKVASDSDEDVKPQVKSKKVPVKGKGKGKARKLDTDSEEDVKPQIKRNGTIKANKAPASKKKVEEGEEDEDKMDEDEEEEEEDDEWNESNLIICPLSVLHNWESQITEHTDKSKVKYAVFHGKEAIKLRHANLSKYKFVLTTYDQIKGDHKFTLEKNAIRTENLRHQERIEDIEEDLEEAKARLEDSSSRGERELAQKELADAKNALALENDLHQENLIAASKPKKKGRASKKKQDFVVSDEDSDDLFSEDDEEDYEKIKARKIKKDKQKEKEIKESSLFTTKWRRVVLDEAHTIRNGKTAVFRAASDIQADRRWCATGTPIVNKTSDLGSLCHFLGMEPFTDPKLWNKLIELPIKKEKNIGYNLLKNVVSTAVLRRTKNMTTEDGTRIIDLPPLEKFHHTIPLDDETRVFYDEVEAAAKDRISTWAADGELHNNAGTMLVFLMRLRQICNDRSLLPANWLEDVRHRNFAEPILEAGSKLTADQISTLQDKLRAILESGEDCPVCMEALQGKEPRITTCSHAFCRACIEEVIKTNAKCPMDRSAISMGSLVELPPEVVKDEDDRTPEPEQAPEDRSAKANMLVTLINAIYGAAPERKSLVFSSYTSYLDKLAVRLRKEGIPICRFDGRMSRSRRDAVLESFKRPLPEVAPGAAPVRAPAPASAQSSASRSGSSLLDALRAEEQRGTFNSPPASAHRKTKAIPKGHVRSEKARIQRELDGAGLEIPRVMLISMGAGSVGLNLNAASNVFMMDPHWNTALEDQAIDRAHRIGQVHAVKVFHIIAERTIEQRVLEIQASKENVVLHAFKGVTNRGNAIEQERTRNETAGGSGRTRMDDMIALFGLDPALLRRRHQGRI